LPPARAAFRKISESARAILISGLGMSSAFAFMEVATSTSRETNASANGLQKNIRAGESNIEISINAVGRLSQAVHSV
jgi:hypothetical protein